MKSAQLRRTIPKAKLFILIIICILIGISFVIAKNIYKKNVQEETTYRTSPGGYPDQNLQHTDTPQYKEATRYGIQGNGYECSKPIKLVSYTLDKNGAPTNFYPENQEEANLFCEIITAIEYKGKLTVLQKPEVLALISKYQYKEVTIKALEFEYIQDKDFVNRLLPAYKDREIGCIIVLETPNEKKVYLEDEKLETFEELDYKVFQQYLDNVSPADRQLFTDNLQ